MTLERRKRVDSSMLGEALKLFASARLWCRPSVDEYDKLIQSLCLKGLDQKNYRRK